MKYIYVSVLFLLFSSCFISTNGFAKDCYLQPKMITVDGSTLMRTTIDSFVVNHGNADRVYETESDFDEPLKAIVYDKNEFYFNENVLNGFNLRKWKNLHLDKASINYGDSYERVMESLSFIDKKSLLETEEYKSQYIWIQLIGPESIFFLILEFQKEGEVSKLQVIRTWSDY